MKRICLLTAFIASISFLQAQTLSGPSLVCSSGATFTVSGCVCSISWTCSSNVSLVSSSGSSAIFKSIGNGQGWVSVTVNGINLTRNFWSGKPLSSGVTLGVATEPPYDQVKVGVEKIIMAEYYGGGNVTYYEWDFFGWDPYIRSYFREKVANDRVRILLGSNAASTQMVEVFAGNECGLTNQGRMFYKLP